MTRRALFFSLWSLSFLSPHNRNWSNCQHLEGHVYVHVYHVSIQVYPISDVYMFFVLSFIPSSTFRLCQRVSREHEDLSQSEGAYEQLLRQSMWRVSWNIQEATVQDKKCWLIKQIIYSEAIGNLKSFATLRGYKIRHLKHRPQGQKCFGFQNKYQSTHFSALN